MKRNKKMLCMTAGALLTATLLSSCVSSYSLKMSGGEGTPSFGGGIFGGGSYAPPTEDPSLTLPSLPGLDGLDPSHLFNQSGYQLPDGVDFSGFTPDGNYFIADFDSGLSKYNGMGKYLFLLDHKLSGQELADYNLTSPILSKLSDDGTMRPEYVVYGVDEQLKQIVVQRYNEETGTEDSFLFDYVSSAVDGKIPQIPGVDTPTVSEKEPEERYSTEWLEWLIKKDKGTLYPRVEDGTYYLSTYEKSGITYPASPFSIVKGSKSSRFSLSLGLSCDEFSYVGVGDEGGYSWKIFYREKGSTGDFSGFDRSPWKWSAEENYNRFEIEVLAAGMNPSLQFDLSSRDYQMVFIITDAKERILSWWEGDAAWTMSSELYLAKAVDQGIAKDNRKDHVTIPASEPSDRFSTKWFEWLETQDQGREYSILKADLSSSSYDEEYASSHWQIWPYNKGAQNPVGADSRFGLSLSVPSDAADIENYRYDWGLYYRRAGSNFGLKAVEGSLYGYASLGKRNIFYFEPLDHGMTLPSDHATKDFSYEIYFVARDSKSGMIVGWYKAEVVWNDTARAYYKEAVDNSILLEQ